MALWILGCLQVLGQYYTAPDRSFRIAFPGLPVEKKQLVETPLGEIPMTTYLFEASEDLVYLTALSDFPKDSLRKFKPDSLLRKTMVGIQKTLGVEALDLVVPLKKDNYPGLSFRGKSKDLWVVYELYLLDSRLYQIGMLSGNGYPLDTKIETYFRSFELLEGAFMDGLYRASPDAGFKVAFPRKPKTSVQTINTEKNSITIHLFIAEMKNQGIYMVSYSDLPDDSLKNENPQKIMGRAQTSILQNLGLPEPGSQGKRFLGEHPGIHFLAASQQMRVSFQLFLVNGRLYQVGVMSPVGLFNDRMANDFLRSFDLD